MSAALGIKRGLTLIGAAIPRRPDRRVVVLCYHSVHPSLPYRSATPELFSEHLAWLRDNCDCVPLGGLPGAMQRPGRTRPMVSVTFDDGYEDNHRFALPLLVSSGVRATFFLTAGLVEKDPFTLERFEQLRNVDRGVIDPLRWEQIAELQDAGMEIGAHTYTHRNLAGLREAQLEREIVQVKRLIEDHVGRSVMSMAYPFGRPKVHVNARVVASVRRAGYAVAGTTVTRGVRSNDDALAIPRIISTRDPVEVLREKVLGVWDLMGIVRERAPLTLARVISPRDFEF